MKVIHDVYKYLNFKKKQSTTALLVMILDEFDQLFVILS